LLVQLFKFYLVYFLFLFSSPPFYSFSFLCLTHMGNRRRSITITTNAPHVSKSDGTNTLWGHSNSKLLSRLKPNTVNTGHNHQREVTPSASASLTLPLIQTQKIKRKVVDSKKSNDVLLDDSISKKVSSCRNIYKAYLQCL
jgi:hypothetical protein